MAENTITVTLAGQACTISIDPDAYLRVKIYHAHMAPRSPVPRLQGRSYDDGRPPEKRASYTFPVEIGSTFRIDAYNGDGEGQMLSNEYAVEESGLMLKKGFENGVHVEMKPAIASREWHTRARVRIVQEVTSRSVDPYTVRTFHPGDELEMVQWGREGRPVTRDSWWTSFDIDGAHIIEASKVEVIEVLDEQSPESEMLSYDGVYEIEGRRRAIEQGIESEE